MKIKYRSGYADGGFLDDGAVVDEVSGNEVPTGSLEEEVRDDIPAQLSEGEFVVPADVVRFIGLDKLMKMRDAAKKGLASMEAEGQIGGSPAPAPAMSMEMESMDMENDDRAMDALIEGMDTEGFEGEAQNFAKGGMPTYESYTGRKFNEPETIQHLKYVNAEGESMTIPTLRGKALRPIPEGFYLYVAPDEEVIPDEPPENTVEAAATGGDERSQKYVESGKYAGDVGRSNAIRRERVKTLEGLARSDMSQSEVEIMYAALTPQARKVYDTRFRDPKMIDSYMAEGMSSVDLMITAQKTADTQNRQAGTTEPDSSFMPDGKPVDWKKALKLFGAGVTLGPMGLIGVAKGSMSSEEEEETTDLLTRVTDYLEKLKEDPEYNNNSKVPTEIKPEENNQAKWASYTGDDIQAAMYAEEQRTGLNAYGHKVYKEPGTRTVWDDIADVKANQANSVAIRAKNAADQKAMADKIATIDSNDGPAGGATAAAVSAVTGDGGNKDDSAARAMASAKAKNVADAAEKEDHYVGGQYGLASGGLAAKKKPKVKKMRKDSTSGLAAKKKSKERAKAKKGALAAKRT